MTEKKLNLYTSLFFFLVFIPVLTLLVPTVKWAETRPVLLVSIMGYLVLCFVVLTRYNIPGLFIRHHYVRNSSIFATGRLADPLRISRRSAAHNAHILYRLVPFPRHFRV